VTTKARGLDYSVKVINSEKITFCTQNVVRGWEQIPTDLNAAFCTAAPRFSQLRLLLPSFHIEKIGKKGLSVVADRLLGGAGHSTGDVRDSIWQGISFPRF